MRLEDRGKNLGATLKADIRRYVGPDLSPRTWRFWKRLARLVYVHPGLIAVIVYRYGQWVEYRCRIPIVRQLAELTYYYWFNWVRTRLQIELPRTTAIDAGLRINHYGGILINCQIVAGKNLTLTQGVLIGETPAGIPRIGDDVMVGVGAKIIGPVVLGDRVEVGAGAVVTKSFPADAVIAGVPAKLLRQKGEPAPSSLETSPLASSLSEVSSETPAKRVSFG